MSSVLNGRFGGTPRDLTARGGPPSVLPDIRNPATVGIFDALSPHAAISVEQILGISLNPWTPANYSAADLDGWHDPSNATNISLTSGTVLSDTDLSTGGNNDVVGLSGTGPAISSAAINGLDAESFNGTNQYLRSTKESGASVQSFVIVIKPDSVAGGPRSMKGSQTAGGLQFRVESNGALGLIKQNIAVLKQSGSGVIADNTVYIVTGSYNDSTGDYRMHVNGTSVDTGNITPITLVSGNQSLVGYNINNNSEYWSGLIGERLSLGTDNLTNIQLAEGYLAWKWGLVSALDSSHPYKSAAPTVAVSGGAIPFTQVATATLSPFAPSITVDQLLGALVQVATGTVLDQAVVNQTLGALVQSVAAAVLVQAATSQNLGALGQTASALAIVAATAAQALGALGQASTATATVAAAVAQSFGALGQSAAATVRVAATVNQTFGPLGQTATATAPPDLNAVVSQTLGDLGQAATTAVTDALAAAQTLAAMTQAVTATVTDTIAASHALGVLNQVATAAARVAAVVAQTLGTLGQTAAAAAIDTAAVNQNLGALQQVSTASQSPHIVVDQTLPALSQVAAGTVIDRATAAQTLAALVQILTGVAIDSAVVTQALGTLDQTATIEHIRVGSVDQTLPTIGQTVAATAEVRASVSQVLGALAQLAQATSDQSAHAAVSQLLGMLQQVAAAKVPNSAAANQILGMLQQIATGRQARVAHTFIKGTLDIVPPVKGLLGGVVRVKGSLNRNARTSGSLH
jgi:hypothetical protein